MSEVLPNSRMRAPVGAMFRLGFAWVPIFCANCGVEGGFVPEEHCDFAFYLCDERKNNCAARFGEITGTWKMPDEIFWKKVEEAQVEKFGRVLSPAEQIEALKDENHILYKLAKERQSKGS